jgi:hypothetical protein
MVEMLPSAEEIREDPDFIRELNLGMITMTMIQLKEMGSEIAAFDTTTMFDMRQLDHPTMPPFVGSDEEAEALASYLGSLDNGGAASGSGGGAQ